MLLNPLALKLINLILGSNTGSRKLLANHQEKSFKLILPGFSIGAKCDIDGYLLAPSLENYDVIIHIPLDSTTFLIDQDKLAVYKKMNFIGNADFGHELLDIFSKLHLDGIYTKVNSPLMLLLLNKFTDLTKTITIYLKQLANNGSTTLKEYLMYETGDIVNSFEHDKFCNEVDEVNARCERLEQQIKQLGITSKAIKK